MKTSISNGHSHDWSFKSRFTSWNNGHNHQVNLKTKTAMPNGMLGHSHKLLN